MQIAQIDRYRWQVPRSGRMRVPATVFASETMMTGTDQHDPIGQLVNVACAPTSTTPSASWSTWPAPRSARRSAGAIAGQ